MSTITLKAGTGYNAPWFVSEADDLEDHVKNLTGFMGVSADDEDEFGNIIGELSLMQLTALASEVFQGQQMVYGMSGANRKPQGDEPKAVEAKPVEKKDDGNAKAILDFIQANDDEDELKRFFVKHKSEIEKLPEAMKALQAKFSK